MGTAVTMVVILSGFCVICAGGSLMAAVHVRKLEARIRSLMLAPGATELPQVPYRTNENGIVVYNDARSHDGEPYKRCPVCGTLQRSCKECGDSATTHEIGTSHRRNDRHCGSYGERGYYLNFTNFTAERWLCTPSRRVGVGFMWLGKCQQPGIHVHQKCERCGWRGIAHVFTKEEASS